MALHNITGRWGEQAAVDFLVAKGYDIVERNWRLDHLELDIVARHQQRIVFVEVKTRTAAQDADPRRIISPRKLNNLLRCANVYMQRYNVNFSAQFDIIIITGTPDNHQISHYPDAYYPPMKTYR